MALHNDLLQAAIIGSLESITELKVELKKLTPSSTLRNYDQQKKLQAFFETVENEFLKAANAETRIHPQFMLFYADMYINYPFECAERISPKAKVEFQKYFADLAMSGYAQQVNELRDALTAISLMKKVNADQTYDIRRLQSIKNEQEKTIAALHATVEAAHLKTAEVSLGLGKEIAHLKAVIHTNEQTEQDLVQALDMHITALNQAEDDHKSALAQRDEHIGTLQISALSNFQSAQDYKKKLEAANQTIQALERSPAQMLLEIERLKQINQQIVKPGLQDVLKKKIEAEDKILKAEEPEAPVVDTKPGSSVWFMLGKLVSASPAVTPTKTVKEEKAPEPVSDELRELFKEYERIQHLERQLKSTQEQLEVVSSYYINSVVMDSMTSVRHEVSGHKGVKGYEYLEPEHKALQGTKAKLHLALKDVVKQDANDQHLIINNKLKPFKIQPMRELEALKAARNNLHTKVSASNIEVNKTALSEELKSLGENNRSVLRRKK